MKTPDDNDDIPDPGERHAMELIVAVLSDEELSLKRLVALLRLALSTIMDPEPDPDARSETT